jgi:serine/threonine-protein kinase
MDHEVQRDPAEKRETKARRAANLPAKTCRPKRDCIAASGSNLTQETEALLQFRLRAAALILFFGFGVFLVRHVVGLVLGESMDIGLLVAHVLVVLILGGCSLSLCRKCQVSLRNLRIGELIIFGLPAAFFLLLQRRVTVTEVERGHVPSPLSFWPLLIFTYAMFIPNTWRRAALVIGALAVAPIVLFVGMIMAYPSFAALVKVGDMMQHILTLAVSAIAAVFGTQLINTLRHEAFEAKQLGQYRLIERLGRGGMGEVYLAEHRMLKRPCAVKLIRPEKADDPQVLARFEREVQMTARLSHWNTVEIFDYGRTEDGTFFYVMEYLPGLSLEEMLKQHGPLPVERVIHLLQQVCQALREAHSIGLIHRDIKPANIFVAERGGLYDVVKLLDFGLVKPMAEIASANLTLDGTISGTPLFMSPEQARGVGEVDARSDIYSLGAVAYMLLSGHAPFERSSALEVIIAHDRDDAAPLSSLGLQVPDDIERVVLRCLAKRPEDRFQTADSLEQALLECLAANQWTKSRAARWWQEQEFAATERMSEIEIVPLTERAGAIATHSTVLDVRAAAGAASDGNTRRTNVSATT